MTTEQIAELQKTLQVQLETTAAELEGLGHHPESFDSNDTLNEDIDDTATEKDELADRVESYEVQTEEVAALEKQWRNIGHALEKIDLGTYGLCEVCDEHIEEDRLMANPSARTCIAHLDQEDTLE